MGRCQAHIVLSNRTGSWYKLQVLHQYTGEGTEDSGYILLAPGESRRVLTAHYNTGFLTTGRDNFIVHGIELKEVTAQLNVAMITIGGRLFVELKKWRSFHGLFASWKLHTLRSEDDRRETTIAVYGSLVEFVSPSGTSSTDWNHEYDITKLL